MHSTFTLAEYEVLLAELLEEGLSFVGLEDLPDSGKFCVLRHDVDSEVFLLDEMMAIEKKLNISATYFVMLQSTAYNPLSIEVQSVIQSLRSAGHAIGLHYFVECGPGSEGELVADIQRQAKLLEEVSCGPVRAFSYHQPSEAVLSLNLEVPGLVNAYNLREHSGVVYTSDTNMQWRSGYPVDLVRDGVQQLQMLVHPMWWTAAQTDVEDKWIRVRNSLNNAVVSHWTQRERSLSALPTQDWVLH
jgi:peptidoglycan/xylan/chitin deacetylase (PgdA/CDA1 family)